MFSCTKKLFCVQTHERSKQYTVSTQTPRDEYCNLTLDDLPWNEDREAENWEYESIRPYKLNEHGIYDPQLSVCIPKQSEWILKKYIHDVNTCPLYTVEDIERELGIRSEFQYGVKPDWDWLFATMNHVPRYFLKHMDSHTEAIYSRAKKTTNVLEDLRVQLAPSGRQYRRRICISSHSSNITCRKTVSEPVNIHSENARKPVKNFQEIIIEPVNVHSLCTTDESSGYEYIKVVKDQLTETKVVWIKNEINAHSFTKSDTRSSDSSVSQALSGSNHKAENSSHQLEVDRMKPETARSNSRSIGQRLRRFIRHIF